MVRQIAPYRWPSGYDFAIAALEYEPEELTRRYGLVFESLSDDLGEYRRAAIELAEIVAMRPFAAPRRSFSGDGRVR